MRVYDWELLHNTDKPLFPCRTRPELLSIILWLHLIPKPGTIPDCIGTDLTSLEVLELSDNKLDGTIPESLCEIGESLTDLELFSDALTGRCARVCR